MIPLIPKKSLPIDSRAVAMIISLLSKGTNQVYLKMSKQTLQRNLLTSRSTHSMVELKSVVSVFVKNLMVYALGPV